MMAVCENIGKNNNNNNNNNNNKQDINGLFSLSYNFGNA